jgi:cation:H+ antiporter
MLPALCAVIAGLILLVWSADRFVAGASAIAAHFGMPPLMIGMVILGFGTSAPEMVVSALAAFQGNPGIALGNAYGSNIANIGMILGATALISPISVHAGVLRRELPLLSLVTVLSIFLLWDDRLGRLDAFLLLAVFSAVMGWTIRQGWRISSQYPSTNTGIDIDIPAMSQSRACFRLVTGLVVLLISSRSLVWGAVEISQTLGVSDVIIGLTIVSIGTSLPELASSIAAACKGQHDMALGNVLGSNLFNTLAVVGIAGAIRPFDTDPDILVRDMPVMGILTLLIFFAGYGFNGQPGRINRWKGALMLAAYIGYIGFLTATIARPMT